MNVWSLARFPSVNDCNVSSGLNNIGYFAYSINLKITIIDLNSMIDGNNGNPLLRSNTFNRIVIDLQGMNTFIRFWNDYKPKKTYNNLTKLNVYEKINIKPLFVDEIIWGPFIYFRWSVLHTSLNNGLINIWLIPIVDSFSLSSYSPNPSFDLLDLLYKEIISNNIIEFDLTEMKKVDNTITDSFYFDLFLNTENPKIQSCSFSTQKVCLYLNEKYSYYIACFWNNFIVIYQFTIYNYKENISNCLLKKMTNLNDEKLLDKFPYIPYFDCKPIFITKIPQLNNSEIITCCFITDTWESHIYNSCFEIFIGTSIGRILLIQLNYNEIEILNCIKFIELKRIVPAIPISSLNCSLVKNNNNKYIWSASYSANIIFGTIKIEENFINIDMVSSNDLLKHKLPIKTVKTMNDALVDGKLYNVTFFSIDQSGFGILHCFNLDNNTFISVQTLSMNKLSNSQTIFPNFEQIVTGFNNEQLNNPSSSQTNKPSFESLQNVPLSIQNYKNNIEDYTLVSFVNSTIPSQFNYIINDIQAYSVALLHSIKLNTIRIVIVFNPFSVVDHITKRISIHFSNVSKLINDTIDDKYYINDSLLGRLSEIISSLFILNDVRLLLCGPLSMHKIPTIDDSNDESNIETNETKDSYNNNNNNNDIPYYSFLKFDFGKILKFKIDNEDSKYKDNNNNNNIDNDLMSYFTYLFYKNIPSEIIINAMSYLNINDEFQDDLFNYINNSKYIFSNLLLLFICYIVELEPFIPKYMEYIIDMKENYIESTILTLIEFFDSSISLISGICNSNINENRQKIFIFQYKFIYLIRMINSIRCLIVCLYSRSNDQISNLIVVREEKLTAYLKKLQYYIHFQIHKLYKNDYTVDKNDNKYYIWNCINNNTPIQINKLDYLYLKEIKETKCNLFSDDNYNSFICSHNSSNKLNEKTETDNDDCIYSLPICPITFQPITISSGFKHLSCSLCGKITFVHQNLINNDIVNIDCVTQSYNLSEKYMLKNAYISCQICLNLVDFLEI
ncbi:putative low complexity [Cryptosporidium xiaoi]|uniref:Low complexity n=1 Tax=Cryptosporidium xiaoi TaxID=659607 RepID=A0AAV9XY36_9CRYT